MVDACVFVLLEAFKPFLADVHHVDMIKISGENMHREDVPTSNIKELQCE